MAACSMASASLLSPGPSAALTTPFPPPPSPRAPLSASPLRFSHRKIFPKQALRLVSPQQAGSSQFSPLSIRAVSSEETSTTTESPSTEQINDLVADLTAKWDALENKSTVFVYGGGALVALWLSSTIVGAINAVPLLPKIMELVGLGYTGWFVYRYLLFKESRKELVADIEELKAKIAGVGKEE